MSEVVDVAIAGAGPYGLSLGAHLRAADVSFRQFGHSMSLWRGMPAGMFLKSQGFASNLSDPAGTHTLEAFCARTGRPYRSYGLPVPLDTFISYGQWFQSEQVPGLEPELVTQLSRRDGLYRLTLGTSEEVLARNVVVAAGVEHFAHVASPLSGLPPALCTHSSQHADLAAFSGQRVIVVGGGQSALESAALLHENGASVQLVARDPQLAWNGEPLPPDRPLRQRIVEPESGLGSGWTTWFYSTKPDLFRHLPPATRVHRARTALGPAGACWLRSRVAGQFPVLTGQAVRWAAPRGGGVVLGLASADGTSRELAADHVIAATGFRADLRRLPFLDVQLRSALRTVAGTAWVGAGYESSVPGLFFIGPAVAQTFGPVMRFVYGTAHAAQVTAGQLAARASGRKPVLSAAGR